MTKPSPEILQLGYLRLGVQEIDWWRRIADLVGFGQATDAPAGELQLRTDAERDYRIAVHRADVPGLSAVGWEVAGPRELSVVRDRLQALGASVIGAPGELKNLRKVEDMFVTLDPDGLRNEIYWGPNTALRTPFNSPTGTVFESGSCGNGHVTVNVTDSQATLDYYMQGLGFRLSDAAWMEGHSRVYFLRCNARHHSYAFAQISQRPAGTIHVMADIASMDALGEVRDRLLDAGITLSRDLGSHPLDGVVSFYVATPEGFEFELATGTRFISEETWSSDRFSRTGRPWGHRKPMQARDCQ
jgi:3,4-dihydroxy-9,10-secoandrosta-1,3,5(10)-triene-9,17-dione 4,5-dioxygenase